MECFFSSSLSLQNLCRWHTTPYNRTHTQRSGGEREAHLVAATRFFFSFFEPKRGRKHTARSEAAKYFTGLPWQRVDQKLKKKKPPLPSRHTGDWRRETEFKEEQGDKTASKEEAKECTNRTGVHNTRTTILDAQGDFFRKKGIYLPAGRLQQDRQRPSQHHLPVELTNSQRLSNLTATIEHKRHFLLKFSMANLFSAQEGSCSPPLSCECFEKRKSQLSTHSLKESNWDKSAEATRSRPDGRTHSRSPLPSFDS